MQCVDHLHIQQEETPSPCRTEDLAEEHIPSGRSHLVQCQVAQPPALTQRELRRRARELEIERRAIEIERAFDLRMQKKQKDVATAEYKAVEINAQLEALHEEKSRHEEELRAQIVEAKQATRRVEAQAKQRAKATRDTKERAEKAAETTRAEVKELEKMQSDALRAEKSTCLKLRRDSAELGERCELLAREVEEEEVRRSTEQKMLDGVEADLEESRLEAEELIMMSRELEASIADERRREVEAMAAWHGDGAEAAERRREAEERRVAEAVVRRTMEAEEAMLKEELTIAEAQNRALRAEEGRVIGHTEEVRSETAELRAALRGGGGAGLLLAAAGGEAEGAADLATECEKARREVDELHAELEQSAATASARMGAEEARRCS